MPEPEKEKTPEELAQEAAKKAFEAALPAVSIKMAARMGDPHLCPMVDGIKPHVGGPILKGCPTVLIGGMMAARAGDTATCASAPDILAMCCPTVLIGNMPAVRILDQTAHGGAIVMGFPTVVIGT